MPPKESLMDENQQIENQEWIDSLQWIIDHESPERTQEILALLNKTVHENGVETENHRLFSEYVNTIPESKQKTYPGNLKIERKIYNAIRWNAMAMVVKANLNNPGIGGHISTYSSTSMLYEVGFNHFFNGYKNGNPDIVYFQGHASPGLYSRSFVEHRLSEKDLNAFRKEIDASNGLPSYPHPRSLQKYWRYPTVSMGLGPIQAIYQARFQKYLTNRGIKKKSNQKVWTFLGDGEMDEPESTGALSIARREKLDNLIFVVNCNLQRLDGPVRGSGKIINELEGIFAGVGWNVIKVIWGSNWDQLFKKDKKGILIDKFNQMPDGFIQRLSQLNGIELRKEFFNQDEALKSIASEFSDEYLDSLTFGGHDPVKVFNAYQKAIEHENGPTIILAQTVKGYEQQDAGEASNVAHKIKKFNPEQLKTFRDQLELPIEDEQLKEEIPFFRFDTDSEEYNYLKERRIKLNGWLPKREKLVDKIKIPDNNYFEAYLSGSDKKEVTTTEAFVKMLTDLLKSKELRDSIVPIVPDESRTFGMDSMFSKFGIYSHQKPKYEPVDKDSLLKYKEEKGGILIEEGITEAGSMSTFIASGTNHLINDFYMIPFFIYYSMFGFQRIGDLIWAAADARARGFLIGGISGRTSLSGEGLQHADGQSHLTAFSVPNLKAYDPAFAYELAIIIQAGIREMYQDDMDFFYYLTVTNQSYPMPAIPKKDIIKDIISGIYLFKKTRKRKNKSKTVNLLGSGAIMVEVLKAGETLEKDYDIPVNIWSVTSYKALYDNAQDVAWHNLRNKRKLKNIIQKVFAEKGDIFIAVSDFVRAVPLTIANWIPGTYTVLGTDGFGRSDTTQALRAYFGVDSKHIVTNALSILVQKKDLKPSLLNDSKKGIKKRGSTNPTKY
jgi:pyruvate dehydrogenase E1 component